MNTVIILRLIFSTGIFLGLFSGSHQSNQQQYSVAHETSQGTPGQKESKTQLPLVLPFLPDAGDGTQHHDHKDSNVHVLCFDRIKRKKCGFSLRCAFVKILLALTHLAVILMMFSHLNYTVPQNPGRQNEVIQQDVHPKAMAFFSQQNTTGKINR